jgi:hypothetical protein
MNTSATGQPFKVNIIENYYQEKSAIHSVDLQEEKNLLNHNSLFSHLYPSCNIIIHTPKNPTFLYQNEYVSCSCFLEKLRMAIMNFRSNLCNYFRGKNSCYIDYLTAKLTSITKSKYFSQYNSNKLTKNTSDKQNRTELIAVEFIYNNLCSLNDTLRKHDPKNDSSFEEILHKISYYLEIIINQSTRYLEYQDESIINTSLNNLYIPKNIHSNIIDYTLLIPIILNIFDYHVIYIKEEDYCNIPHKESLFKYQNIMKAKHIQSLSRIACFLTFSQKQSIANAILEKRKTTVYAFNYDTLAEWYKKTVMQYKTLPKLLQIQEDGYFIPPPPYWLRCNQNNLRQILPH